MNKSDIKLVSIVFVISLLFIFIIKLNNTSGGYALVYYENEIVEKIDINTKEDYIVDGYNGKVIIETNYGKVRVKEETSPRHLCSKQGWVSSSLEPIICLPNKIVIKIEQESADVDTVVR